MKQINIGLLGCGTVGTGVAKLLIENKDLLTARVGSDLKLKWVADLDTQSDRGVDFPEGVFISDAEKVVGDPEIDVVIEMIGGENVANAQAVFPSLITTSILVTARRTGHLVVCELERDRRAGKHIAPSQGFQFPRCIAQSIDARAIAGCQYDYQNGNDGEGHQWTIGVYTSVFHFVPPFLFKMDG